MNRIVAAAVLGVALAGSAPSAQAQDDVDVAAVGGRAPSELSCLEAAQARMGKAIRLLRESYGQLRSAPNPRLEQDAARAIVSLEQRLRELAEDLEKCVAEAPSSGGKVVYVAPPPDPVADAVSKANPATDVVDRNRSLGPYLRIRIGQKVDGTGRVPERSVRNGVTRVARPLTACYERLIDHGALERGELVLLFTVRPDGRVRHVKVERSDVGGAGFARCAVLAARRSLRIDAPAVGGNATYSYTFLLGPSASR